MTDTAAHRARSATAHSSTRHPVHHRDAPAVKGTHVIGSTIVTVVGLLVAATLVFALCRKTMKARSANRAQAAIAAEAEALAAKTAAERRQRKAEQIAYDRARAVWVAAEGRADETYTGSLLLHENEIVGYGTGVERVVTHKVGHRTDRTSSRTGTSAGTTRHRSSGASSSQGVGFWNVRQGASVSSGSGTGAYASENTSTATGHAYSQDDIKTEIVDKGQLVITNQRVVFQGDNATLEIPIEKVVGFHFKDDSSLVVDYAKRLTGECYIVHDALSMRMAMTKRLNEPGFEIPPKPLILQTPRPGA